MSTGRGLLVLKMDRRAYAFSTPQSASYLSTPSAAQPVHVAPLTQSRPLPGYRTFAAATQPVLESVGSGLATPVRPYQSRERLYYENERKVDGSGTDAGRRPALSVNREDAPPTASLYDFSLSPERRHVGDASPARHMEIDQLGVVCEAGAGVDDGTDCWVTVFGFAGASLSQILSFFKNLGTVDKYEVGQGNWVHIQYTNRWSAQKALCKNGSILPAANACMIGVLPTKAVMNQVDHAAVSFMSPLKRETLRGTPGHVLDSTGVSGAAETPFSFKKPIPKQSVPSVQSTPMHRQAILPSPVQPAGAAMEAQRVEARPGAQEDFSVFDRIVSYFLGWQ